eukprot:m.64731 g.64731  ORF g.64731 m.64731 type:complete len:994 (+) comp35274_c0_seq12:68-3049(+)
MASKITTGVQKTTGSWFEAFLFITLVVYALPPVASLYEDQVGQFDWRTSQLGRIQQVQFDQSTYSTKRVILATQANALASINARTGQIIWRQVLEPDGKINRLLHHSGVLVTVSQNGTLVRSWDPSTGHLVWETSGKAGNSTEAVLVPRPQAKGYLVLVLSGGSLHSFGHSRGREMWRQDIVGDGWGSPVFEKWMIDVINDDTVCVIHMAEGASVSLHWTNVSNGNKLKSTKSVSTPWLSFTTSSCIITPLHYLVCIDGDLHALYWLSLDTAEESPSFSTILLSTLDIHVPADSSLSLKSMASDFLLSVQAESFLLSIDASSQFPIIRKKFLADSQIYCGSLADTVVLFQLTQTDADTLDVKGFDAQSLDEVPDVGQTVAIPPDLGRPEEVHVYMFLKKDKSLAYRMLLITEDDALSLVQQNGRVTWTRDESLADITNVEVVDFPVSEGKTYLEGLYRNLSSHSADPFSLFAQRISIQLAQLQAFISSFNGYNNKIQDVLPAEGLTRDKFNLRKFIVALTSAGKLFGIDSQSGKILWKLYFSDLAPLAVNSLMNEPVLFLGIQRRTDSHSLPPQVVIIGASKSACQGSVLYIVNPLTGKLLNKAEDHCLGYHVKHISFLPIEESNFLQIVLLVDTDNKVHIYPSTKSASDAVMSHPQAIYLHSVYPKDSKIVGYTVEKFEKQLYVSDQQENLLYLTNAWHVQLPSDRKIVNYAVRPSHERVNDQARILSDRSALYKYLNPNIIALATEVIAEKGSVEILLIDGVTGSIIYRVKQRQAKGPVHIVHSENWVVYSLWNMRARRHEVTVLEMYESVSATRNETHVSSLDSHLHPEVLRKSFIFPTAVNAMGVTLTEKGITSKSVLFALHTGSIMAVPKLLLDPRRPLVPKPSDSEEGLIPYIPFLSLVMTEIVNYNQTVNNIKGLVTVPAGLESTCLLFTYGLDLYFTRVTPSRKFDVLAEDFDSNLIITVLLGLALAALLSANLAKRKRLQSAWK